MRLTVLFLLSLFIAGCTVTTRPDEKPVMREPVDVSGVPSDTLLSSYRGLILTNGIYYADGKPVSGFIRETYGNGRLKSVGSYYRGRQHGITRTYYADGTPRDERTYKDNVSYGRHFGFWENGHRKFDFVYYDDKREGLQKQWYETGEPYAFLTFANDQESGMQQAWRQNGKLYINYETKDGIRYGLQKSALCYTLRDEKFE